MVSISIDLFIKKQAVSILSIDNYKQWFHLMTFYFKLKKIYYVIITMF